MTVMTLEIVHNVMFLSSQLQNNSLTFVHLILFYSFMLPYYIGTTPTIIISTATFTTQLTEHTPPEIADMSPCSPSEPQISSIGNICMQLDGVYAFTYLVIYVLRETPPWNREQAKGCLVDMATDCNN